MLLYKGMYVHTVGKRDGGAAVPVSRPELLFSSETGAEMEMNGRDDVLYCSSSNTALTQTRLDSIGCNFCCGFLVSFLVFCFALLLTLFVR